MRIKILIRLKSQILEPQGKVIEKSLSNLGLSNLTNIRQGKLIELDISDKLSEVEKNDLITSESLSEMSNSINLPCLILVKLLRPRFNKDFSITFP